MGFEDVIARETDWLSTEPLAGFDALLRHETNDGPFDFIGEYTRRLAQHPRQLHVYRERSLVMRESTGTKRLHHSMLVGVLWTQTAPPERAYVEQTQLDLALARLVQRIGGQLDDHTHGQRFFSAGETGSLSPAEGIDVRWPDWRSAIVQADSPLAMGRAYVVEVRYPIVEFVEG